MPLISGSSFKRRRRSDSFSSHDSPIGVDCPSRTRRPLARSISFTNGRLFTSFDRNPKKFYNERLFTDIPPERDRHATRTLYVGNLDPTLTEDDVSAVFEKYGPLTSVFVKRVPPHRPKVRPSSTEVAH